MEFFIQMINMNIHISVDFFLVEDKFSGLYTACGSVDSKALLTVIGSAQGRRTVCALNCSQMTRCMGFNFDSHKLR